MDQDERSAAFRAIVLSNLDAAHNLAWWLTHDEHEAADAVQDACLKAWRSFAAFRGGDAKAWLLSIVRTTVISRKRRERSVATPAAATRAEEAAAPRNDNPIAPLLHAVDRRLVDQAIASLPDSFREVLVLREMEGLSYAQIAIVVGAPIGTVMSRLSRARDAARELLRARIGKE